MAGLAAQLRYMKSLYFGPPPSKGVMEDLEYTLWTKGGLTPEEEKTLRVYKLLPALSFVAGSVWGTFVGWFGFGKGLKLVGLPLPPSPRFIRFCAAYGGAYLGGKTWARAVLYECPAIVLNTEEGRLKMELANMSVLLTSHCFSLASGLGSSNQLLVSLTSYLLFPCFINRILNKHSDDAYLVKVVKRHFFSEHLFHDLHQDQPLFRWHPRRSYIDSTFVERMKEVEAANSDDVARSISGEINANTTPFGDLMEDSLACILGSPGCNMEGYNPPEKTGTVLKRSEPRARRRGRRHHHRHADD